MQFGICLKKQLKSCYFLNNSQEFSTSSKNHLEQLKYNKPMLATKTDKVDFTEVFQSCLEFL